MQIHKAYKFRLCPTAEQAAQIDKTLNTCRYVYNHMLRRNEKAFKRRGEHLSYIDMQNLLPDMKEYHAWLKEVDSQALKYSCRQVNEAYQGFFKQGAGYPRFKSKKNRNQSYTTTKGSSIHVFGNSVQLPTLGEVPCKVSKTVEGVIKKATVRKTPTGKYYVSILAETEIKPLPVIDTIIGIDMGLKELATDSNGNSYENPKWLKVSLRKLAREQRKLSRTVKGSKNREKQRLKVARIHEKVVNQRTDYLHKMSSTLVNENQVICVETLNIKGMVRNRKLARSIADASWGEFVRQLEYKASWAGRELIKVPTFYPSSQTCSHCGYKNPLIKDLKIRNWFCPECGTYHNRDENAAKNILMKGVGIPIPA